jgi:thiol:disulfide interchange protein DsbC
MGQPSTQAAPKGAKIDDIRAQLAAKLPGAKPEDVRPSAIPGMYEIALGSSIGYISADGKYLISGDMYEIASKNNLTENRRTEARIKVMANLKDSDLIVFSPVTPPKHIVTIFTDVDCSYCRKLHSEIAELNKMGIRVRYAAYPRGGPGTESWAKFESVWCSKDRRAALTDAKMGESVKANKCATPVAAQYKMGEDMGVRGTPAIYTSTGEYVSGYLPAQELAAYLDELTAPPAKPAGGKSGG